MSRKGEVRINAQDVIGKCLGKLQVNEYAGSAYDYTLGGERLRHYYWCDCDCGRRKKIRRSVILAGKIKSCGCARRRR